jgi:hypothetical protein
MRRWLRAFAITALAAAGIVAVLAAAGFAAPIPPRLFADKRPSAIPVVFELVLAVDVFLLIDPEDQAIQRERLGRALI